MAETATLLATPRLTTGKGPANQAREAGHLPAVIYGDKKTPDIINLDPKAFNKEMHRSGFNTRIFTIDVEGKAQQALAKAVQLHPVTDRPLHVDFLRVTSKTVVHVKIPLKFINEDKSPGLKKGGVLNVVHHDIELVCKADSIPQVLEVDLSGTDIGHAFHMNVLTFPAGTKPASADTGYTIATLLAPKIEVIPTDAPKDEALEAAKAEAAKTEGKPDAKADNKDKK